MTFITFQHAKKPTAMQTAHFVLSQELNQFAKYATLTTNLTVTLEFAQNNKLSVLSDNTLQFVIKLAQIVHLQ